MSAVVHRWYHWLMKNKICLAQVDKCPCKYHSADPKRRLWACSCTPLLKQLFTRRTTSGIFCNVKKSCHGEISHSSDETNYLLAEINPECTNGGEWRVAWCFLLKVECNWLLWVEEGMADLWFYCRVWAAAMCCLGAKRRKGTLKAFGMLCITYTGWEVSSFREQQHFPADFVIWRTQHSEGRSAACHLMARAESKAAWLQLGAPCCWAFWSKIHGIFKGNASFCSQIYVWHTGAFVTIKTWWCHSRKLLKTKEEIPPLPAMLCL